MILYSADAVVYVDGIRVSHLMNRETNMANRPTRPLTCYDCGETKRLNVSSGTQKRRRGTNTGEMVTRTVTNVECRNCGNEWWSAHRDAIKQARSRDTNREAYHARRKGDVTREGSHPSHSI